MTKSEYSGLYDQFLYGHDADLQIEGHRFFVEWNESEITIYQMYEDSGIVVAVLRGEKEPKSLKRYLSTHLSMERV